MEIENFSEGYRILCKRFNQDVDPEIAELYYLDLRDLSDPDWEKAWRSAFYEDRFFPSPRDLREKITGSPEDSAIAAWDQIMAANPRERWDWPDEIGWECLKSIGGLKFVHDMDLNQLQRIRRDFITTYSLKCKKQRSKQVESLSLRGPILSSAPKKGSKSLKKGTDF